MRRVPSRPHRDCRSRSDEIGRGSLARWPRPEVTSLSARSLMGGRHGRIFTLRKPENFQKAARYCERRRPTVVALEAASQGRGEGLGHDEIDARRLSRSANPEQSEKYYCSGTASWSRHRRSGPATLEICQTARRSGRFAIAMSPEVAVHNKREAVGRRDISSLNVSRLND